MDELRIEYAGKPTALTQIEIYDLDSQYNMKLRALRDAFEKGDSIRISEIKQWIEDKYPEQS